MGPPPGEGKRNLFYSPWLFWMWRRGAGKRQEKTEKLGKGRREKGGGRGKIRESEEAQKEGREEEKGEGGKREG